MKKIKFYILTLVAILSMAGLASAQATLSVQGTIQKSTGAAVDDGDYTLIFKLYTTEIGGTPVWSETQSTVTIIGGVYSVTLGSVNPLTAAFDQPYYLGVAVGSGTELTPRARLTSSPYALSLIGQDNIFPSTGAVGAGTATPTAGYQLHVKAVTGDGKLLVEGENNAKIDLKKGANTVGITYNGSAVAVPGTVNMPGTVNIGTLNTTNFNPSNFTPAQMAVVNNLSVGQNTVNTGTTFVVAGNSYMTGNLNMDGTLNINGSVAASPVGYYIANAIVGPAPFNSSYSMTCTQAIRAQHFLAVSDRRIKKDFRFSENLADLATLRKLRVTDYRHIDQVQHGNAFTKGFIAQEVKETYPEAVKMNEDFIPNVFALANKAQLADGKMTISMEKNHEFAVGDEVKLMLEKGEKTFKVAAVPAENTFAIDWNEMAVPDKIFVYGKKVKDFHAVDYDRIFTLNVSATQELARRVEQLEAENAALRQRNDGLQQQNDGLRGDVNDIYKRLQDLEKRSHLEK
jgi:hypothetical protein